MTNSVIDDYFIQLLTFNDFKTLFLMVVAVFIVKPLSYPACNGLPSIVYAARRILRIEKDDSISDRAIISTTYGLLSIFAGVLTNIYFSGFPVQQKIISAILWPLFAYVLATVLGILLTTIFFFPFDLLRIAIASWRKFHH